jgi:hypothetical protein
MGCRTMTYYTYSKAQLVALKTFTEMTGNNSIYDSDPEKKSIARALIALYEHDLKNDRWWRGQIYQEIRLKVNTNISLSRMSKRFVISAAGAYLSPKQVENDLGG